MCMSVLLPEPDGPMMAVSRPALDVDVDVAQGVHGGVALAVPAREPAGADDRQRCGGERALELFDAGRQSARARW